MTDLADPAPHAATVRHPIDGVVIRFAGDSGDGMQLTGDRFTQTSAVFGNDLSTLPDYPAEIRAPAGTVAGVSAFQVNISDHRVLTPGDVPDVLVAMNPAALKANLADLPLGATLIVNSDSFSERDLTKAGYAPDANPLTDGTLARWKVYEVPMTSMTLAAAAPTGAKPRDAERSKNLFALGVICWLYGRAVEPTVEWIEARFASKPTVLECNRLALHAGFNFGETAELFEAAYDISPAPLPPGEYVNVNGNTALAWGLVAAGQLAKLPVFLGSYPITPASDILHELSKHKHFGVRTMQAEDEIAGIGAALGAAYAGHLGVTTTSGPGVDLKAEMLGLAVSLELPLLLIDIQRGGPSTGLPTKTEQADLMLAMYGRHGESPIPILAARSPSHCFEVAIEAARIAITYRTPVIVLSDGYLANGTEPWCLPDVDALEPIEVTFADGPNHGTSFWPFKRDEETLARPWAIPGTPGLQHRIGGLEKADGTGDISYDGHNHELMTHLRADKIAGIVKAIPATEVDHVDGSELLVLGWGSTYGSIAAAVARVRAKGIPVDQAHLMHLNPFPGDLGAVLRRYRRVLVPEMNLGQLSRLVRAEFLVDAQSLSKVQGRPFRASEIETAILDHINR